MTNQTVSVNRNFDDGAISGLVSPNTDGSVTMALTISTPYKTDTVNASKLTNVTVS
jgi:hypothetical protein